MIEQLSNRLHTTLMLWLCSGFSWKTMLVSLGISLALKSLINFLIEPIPSFPPGPLALTHSEHWADDGLGSLVVIGWSLILVFLFPSLTLRFIHQQTAHLGAGLYIAGAVSNRGEIWLFGHATDFLFVLFAIFNLADVLICSGLLMMLLWSPLYKLLERKKRVEVNGPFVYRNRSLPANLASEDQVRTMRTGAGDFGR